MRVGMPRTLKRCGVLGFSSMLSLAIVTFSLYSVAISLSMGAIILQGPHHSAQKSSNTGPLALTTSSSKLASVTCTIVSLLTRNSPPGGWTGWLIERVDSVTEAGRGTCVVEFEQSAPDRRREMTG